MRAHMWVRISSVLLIAFEGTYVATYVGTYVGTDAE